jgi:hypothetical protein
MPPEPSSLTFSQRSSTMRRLRVVQALERAGDAVGGQAVALGRFEHGGGLVAVVGQVGDRAEGLLAVAVGRRRVQQHVAAGQARFHLALPRA